ncbi:importin-5-like protein isoform X1 [Tanacetum coccineum]
MLNAEVRDGSVIWLQNLIKKLLVKGTQNQVKDTLLIHAEIEDDVNVRISLCHTLAKAFIVFDVENWGPELSDQSPNVGTRLEMLLEQLIGKPLVIVLKTSLKCHVSNSVKKLLEESLAEDTQFHQVKHILLSRVEIEDDGNVMKSLCHRIAKAFIVFGGENGWSDLFPYILYFLENQTNAEIRATIADVAHISALVGCSKKSTEDTQIQVKHIFLSRVVTEDDGNVRISLCRTIANAFTVFGNENGWPELSVFINECVEVDNDLLKETAMLILANLLEQSTNVATRDESTFILEMLLGLLIHNPLDDRTKNLVKMC